MQFPPDRVLWGSSIELASLAGMLGGIAFAFAMVVEAHPPVRVHGSGASVPTVVFEGFRDGALRGHAAGPLRLYAQDTPLTVDSGGTFAIVHPAFRIEEVTIPVPPGMKFVASKKGKKYYTVTSASGERIAPENRVYFATEAAAQAAGFTR